MKRTVTIVALVLAVALGGLSLDVTRPTSVVAKSGMPDPALTGAPSQGSCYNCHNAGLNDGFGGLFVYNVPPAYTPGQSTRWSWRSRD
jgi:hypothetical protein